MYLSQKLRATLEPNQLINLPHLKNLQLDPEHDFLKVSPTSSFMQLMPNYVP